jgi:cysteinyl-tRNA synthetase
LEPAVTRQEQIDALINERSQARLHQDWAASDRLREQLQALGVRVEDNKPGSIYTRVCQRRPCTCRPP